MKKVLAGVLLATAVGAGLWLWWQGRAPAPPPQTRAALPTFVSAPAAFAHRRASGDLPRVAVAALDVDGDGTLEVFFGGGAGQADGLYAYRRGAVVARCAELPGSAHRASYDARPLDANGDGWPDLVVARQGELAVYLNQGGTFQVVPLSLPLAATETPFAVAVGDLERDGLPELAVLTVPGVDGESPRAFAARTLREAAVRLYSLDPALQLHPWPLPRTQAAATLIAPLGDDGRPVLLLGAADGVWRWRPGADSAERLLDCAAWALALAATGPDGRLELAAAGPAAAEGGCGLRRWPGDGATAADDGAVLAAAAADLDLDGGPDVLRVAVEALPLAGALGRAVALHMAGRGPDVAAHTGLPAAVGGAAPLVADLNGDAYPDVVFAPPGGEAQAWLNAGGNAAALELRLPIAPPQLGSRVDAVAPGFHATALSGQTAMPAAGPHHRVVLGLGRRAGEVRLNVEPPLPGQPAEGFRVPPGRVDFTGPRGAPVPPPAAEPPPAPAPPPLDEQIEGLLDR